MDPVYQETQDPVFTWKIGLVACFFSGVIETLGTFAGNWVRSPRRRLPADPACPPQETDLP